LMPANVRSSTHISASAGGFNVSPQVINRLPAPIHDAITASFVHAIDMVFLVAVPFAVLTFLISLALRELKLRTSSGLFADGEVAAGAAEMESELARVAEATAPVGIDYGA
ncbi:MAG TPA: hypothetical protein VE991_12315, partial [Acidimicrobiales bacterium]|nr:hypothetical protein [Acidimicrobiales bacterium]